MLRDDDKKRGGIIAQFNALRRVGFRKVKNRRTVEAMRRTSKRQHGVEAVYCRECCVEWQHKGALPSTVVILRWVT